MVLMVGEDDNACNVVADVGGMAAIVGHEGMDDINGCGGRMPEIDSTDFHRVADDGNGVMEVGADVGGMDSCADVGMMDDCNGCDVRGWVGGMKGTDPDGVAA